MIETHGDKAFSAWMARPHTRAALVIAHPGHELRLDHWLGRSRPNVHILTNGSRAGGDLARREASLALVTSRGARIGAAWPGIPDLAFYDLILNGASAPFQAWASALADDFVRDEIDLVVTDGWQYYNIAHDLTHLMARVAAAEASAIMKRAVRVVDYAVVPRALAPTAPVTSAVCEFMAPKEAAAAKRARTRAYPAIAAEIAEIEAIDGEAAYAVEAFFAPPPLALLRARPQAMPTYERYGEMRVSSGIYADVLRWRHVEGIVRDLADRHDAAAAIYGALPHRADSAAIAGSAPAPG